MNCIEPTPKGNIMQQSSEPDVRRQFQRNPVRAHAFVHARGRFQPATVVDYSHGGLQLEGTFGLFKFDSVQIEFISGIRVPGQVAWSLGGRAGIAFSEGLPTTHPAIVELARKAARLLNQHSRSITNGARSGAASGPLA